VIGLERKAELVAKGLDVRAFAVDGAAVVHNLLAGFGIGEVGSEVEFKIECAGEAGLVDDRA
jgi:hypothetical protein